MTSVSGYSKKLLFFLPHAFVDESTNESTTFLETTKAKRIILVLGCFDRNVRIRGISIPVSFSLETLVLNKTRSKDF